MVRAVQTAGRLQARDETGLTPRGSAKSTRSTDGGGEIVIRGRVAVQGKPVAMRILRHLAPVLLAACGEAPADDVVSTTETGDTHASSTSVGALESTSTGSPETSTTTGVADTSSESGSGGEVPPCELPAGSPPPTVVDGLTLVPIDTISIDAHLRFDIATSKASGHAELTFALGPEDGLPVFDLRQEITAIELDGVELTADDAPFVAPNGDTADRMRALAAELTACSEHTLVIDYEVWEPDADSSLPPIWVTGGGVKWHAFLSDAYSGRFLEQWMPANLPHDEVSITVGIEVVGESPHVVAANGEVTPIAANHWRVEFPPDFTAMSPLIVLLPEALAEVTTAPVRLPDGDVVTVELVKNVEVLEQTADIIAATGEALIATNLELGEYVHGDRFLIYASYDANFMEYEGATTALSFAIPHEVFHSWIGRGLRPLMHRDAWFDEGWTMYSVEHEFAGVPLLPSDRATMLAPDDAWMRQTGAGAYDEGSRLFATLAAEIGTDELRGVLREFYVAHAGELVTTEQLEAHLVAAIPGDTPEWLFARFVYGQDP